MIRVFVPLSSQIELVNRYVEPLVKDTIFHFSTSFWQTEAQIKDNTEHVSTLIIV